MTGEGIVLPEADQVEVERRAAALRADLRPQSPVGSILIRKMAVLSVRSERLGERENSRIAERVRNAVEDFDQGRCNRADALLDALQDNPRTFLRKLLRMPEGVDRLLVAWRTLRDDLAINLRNNWGGSQLTRMAVLSGIRVEHANASRLGALSNAVSGDFFALTDEDGAGLDRDDRQIWARDRLRERVDAEIAGLEAHRRTLDHDRIEQDRREAPARAGFDDSRAASLERRYEADADRGFYKALKEFRQVEAEAVARIEPTTARPNMPPAGSRMGSSRGAAPPMGRGPVDDLLDLLLDEKPVVRGVDWEPLSIIRPSKPPG